MRVRLAVAALVNSVFINVQANMAAGASRINMDMLFTNRKLPSIHSESVATSRSKARAFSFAEKRGVYCLNPLPDDKFRLFQTKKSL